MVGFLSRNIITGLVTILPVVLTLYLLYWLAVSAESALGRMIRLFLPDRLYWPGMGLVAGLTAVFVVGLLMHTYVVQRVFAKGEQLLASGTGQTSRVDALNQAIVKAKAFGFDLNGAVMASDAFFPFPDCVEIAKNAGISAVVQPGGSIKDQLSVDYCDANDMAMVMTGIRHFRH